MLTEALTAWDNGLTPIPILPAQNGEEKKPAIPWKQLQTTRPTRQQTKDWFTPGNRGVGIICGTTSRNLHMIELEGRAQHLLPKIVETATASGLQDLILRIFNGWAEQSPTGGWHFYVTHDGPPIGNTKLASRPSTPEELKQSPERTKTLAETRGEGGYTIIAPTTGDYHNNGQPWVRISGGPATAAHLTEEELEDVFALFRMHNETPQPATPPPAPTPKNDTTGRLTPGDDYNQRATWADILEPQGWTPTHTAGQTTYWARPGKTAGVSATTNHTGTDRLHVFTTSTTLDADQSYSKFYVYAHYHHADNLTEATKHLATQGYGDPTVHNNPFAGLPTRPNKPLPKDNMRVVTGGNQPETSGSSALQPQPAAATINTNELNETTNANYLIDTYGHIIRHVTDSDKWVYWNGHMWEPTGKNEGQIKQLTINAITALPADDPAIKKWRNSSLNHSKIQNTIKIASTDPRISINQDELDQHPTQLNTPQGIVNLKTGELTPPDPKKLHSKTTLTTPNQNCPTPLWNQFLEDTFHGHPGMIPYVQQLAGYTATGLVGAQILPFLYGSGANGKSVFVDVLTELLGDYATPAPANFLTPTREQHPTEIARLKGIRFLTASEVAEGSRFDEIKIKQLTGGDKLTARYMNGDFFDFHPTHKIWLSGNHQPKVQTGGYSFWRRLRLIPFTNTVPEHKRIADLTKQLIEKEGPGILHWIIRGATEYLTYGFTEPQEVTDATKAYEESEDELGRFIADRVILGGGTNTRVSYKDIRHAYTEWCRLEGLTPATANMFTREIRSRFNIDTVRSNGTRYYTNCTLTKDTEDTPNNPWGDLGGNA